MVSDEKLKKLYVKYVKRKFFYRVVSAEYVNKIKKKGLNPKLNPFGRMKKDLISFFDLVERLYVRGDRLIFRGPYRTRTSLKIAQVMKRNLDREGIDLSPVYSYNYFYMKMRGGSLVSVVNSFIEQILERNIDLTKKELQLIKKLKKWANNRQKYDMAMLKIPRTTKELETACFNRLKGVYLPSPFGSFDNFKKVINKIGLKKYESFLKGDKRFYLKVKEKIPSEEIIFN